MGDIQSLHKHCRLQPNIKNNLIPISQQITLLNSPLKNQGYLFKIRIQSKQQQGDNQSQKSDSSIQKDRLLNLYMLNRNEQQYQQIFKGKLQKMKYHILKISKQNRKNYIIISYEMDTQNNYILNQRSPQLQQGYKWLIQAIDSMNAQLMNKNIKLKIYLRCKISIHLINHIIQQVKVNRVSIATTEQQYQLDQATEDNKKNTNTHIKGKMVESQTIAYKTIIKQRINRKQLGYLSDSQLSQSVCNQGKD